ncbi:uncharacterized protein LOC110825989 isoform X1 [Carica papaya]|uniref:uncharacterized protein LOC110825989 isoform X1 n=1 Tax=Carica papaya TaxID=3649 RepID=UPI000B8CF062|nr:uncharacterized protein LOC110825989 isoform X1 [Carica papaya]
MMGCLSACFSSSKQKKRRHLVNKSASVHQRSRAGEEALQAAKSTKEQIQQPINPIAESEEKLEDPISCGTEKKVRFNLSLKASEEFPTVGKNEEEKKSEKKEETPEESKSLSTSNLLTLFSHPPNNRYQNCASTDDDEYEDLDLEEESSLDDGCNDDKDGDDCKKFVPEESSESLFSLSIESRKQVSDVELGEKEVTSSPVPKCSSPVAELKVIELNRNAPNRNHFVDSVFNPVENVELGEKEVSSPVAECISPVAELQVIELNRNARDGNQFVDSVLNPVENVTQWKAIKPKALTHLQSQEKENMYPENAWYGDATIEQPNFKHSTRKTNLGSKDKKLLDQEITVDTSLSTWLVETEVTPFSEASTNSVGNSPSIDAKSPRNHEDRPILGALTMEEVKQHSISTSPKRSKNWSPDETPIIGTVGSYWRHTGQTPNSDSTSSSKGMSKPSSRNRKDGRANWDATSFKTRLDQEV